MAYAPYPIADFRSGKVHGKAPWLQTSDAFPVLTNGRVDLGVLEKRYGSTLLATTGAGLAIMGIFEARYQGVPHVLVADTKRLYEYNIIADTLTDLSLANTYTGADYDYFKFCNYYEKTYLVNGINGVDEITYASGTAVIADLDTAAGAGTVAIATCRGMFVFKDRLHFVAPTIGSTFYPDRIYYTDVNATIITNSTQWYRYPRDDVPVSYHALDMNNILILGHQSSWRVEYTGDSDTPFAPKTIDTIFTPASPHILVEYQNPAIGRMIATIATTHIVGFDGFQWRKIDFPIRDLPTEMTMRYLYYAQGCRAGDRESLYLTYPDTDDTYPTHILEHNINENSWADHTLTMHALARISGEVKPTDYSLTTGMVARVAQGYTYGGDRSGNLFRLDYGSSDNGTDITFTARSAALNPFHPQGRRAYLGWVDVYADHDANGSLTFNFYKDDDTTAYKTVAFSCDGTADRFWQRVNVGGEIGNFHRIELTNTGSGNRPRIHALVPWFKIGGVLAPTSDASAAWPNNTWRLHRDGAALYVQRKDSGVWTNYQTWGA